MELAKVGESDGLWQVLELQASDGKGTGLGTTKGLSFLRAKSFEFYFQVY